LLQNIENENEIEKEEFNENKKNKDTGDREVFINNENDTESNINCELKNNKILRSIEMEENDSDFIDKLKI